MEKEVSGEHFHDEVDGVIWVLNAVSQDVTLQYIIARNTPLQQNTHLIKACS
jgi:hypothetical protein